MNSLNKVLFVIIIAALSFIGYMLYDLLTNDKFKNHKYTLVIEKCNGGIDTVDVIINGYPEISTYRQAVPVIFCQGGDNLINVCKFEILKKHK